MSAGIPEAESDAQRRLAAIVAVDVAGYAGRAEIDEAQTIREVRALSDLIAQAAAAHGGRVFSSAGDGFMLEFPTCSGALAAAEDIAGQAPTPVRIGVHLGEVSVGEDGDLLGHGVNVAARLQALAAPGGVAVSGDVARTLRGPQAERLAPRGRVRLDKMKEVVEVFALSPAKTRKPAWRPTRRLVLAAAALLLAMVGAGLFFALRGPAPGALTTAVRAFDVVGADPALGEAMADRLNAALAGRQAPTLARDLARRGQLGGARLVVNGAIERDGEVTRVRAHVADTASGVELWSTSLSRPNAQGADLMDQAATEVADIIALTGEDLGTEPRLHTPELLSAYMRMLAINRRGRGSSVEAREAARRVIELAPQLWRGHAELAASNAGVLAYTRQSPEAAQRLRAEAEAAAGRAMTLNPKSGYPYLALANLERWGDPLRREPWLVKGVALEPDDPTLIYALADHHRSVGRTAEAMAGMERALARDPNSRPKTAGLIYGLAGAGRWPEARVLARRAARLWGDNASIRRANLLPALINGDPAEGEAALTAFQASEPRMDEASHSAWQGFLAARRGAYPTKAAARALTEAARGETGVDPSAAVSALALLGETDLAFAEIARARQAGGEFHVGILFEPATASLRRDPRFMPEMAHLGLAQYWLATGKWPDFCAAPGPGYDCKAAAAKAVAAAKP